MVENDCTALGGLTPGANALADRTVAGAELLDLIGDVRIRLLSAKVWHQGPEWSIAPRDSPDVWLFVPLRGRVRISSRGRDHVIGPGEAVLVPRGWRHDAAYDAGCQAWDSVSLHLHFAGAAAVALAARLPLCVISLSEPRRRHQDLLDLVALANRGAGATAWWAGQVVGGLLRDVAAQGLAGAAPPAMDPTVVLALDLLAHQPAVSMSALAAQVGLSASRLRARVMAATGRSPKAIQQELRMAEAARRLLADDAAVADVARELGFTQASWFHATFKRTYGTTPGSWRTDGRGRM